MTSKMKVIRFLLFTLLMITMGAAMAGDPVKGRTIYGKRCAGCHGPNGLPQVPGVPNFSIGEGIMKSDQEILQFVKKGKTVMPGFEGVLTDQEILDVIAHIRTLF
jgi:cytochrome c6